MNNNLNDQPPAQEMARLPRPFSHQELREISFQIASGWFKAPRPTRLTLMEVNPWRLHAYWNLAEEDWAAARAQLPERAEHSPLVLRFTDLGAPTETGATQRFDIEVDGLRNNWYVDLWQDGRRYSAELGLRKPNGELIALADSNEVALPRASSSGELAFRQVEIRGPRPHDPVKWEASPPENEQILDQLLPRQRPLTEPFPEALPDPHPAELAEPDYPGSHRLEQVLEQTLPPSPFADRPAESAPEPRPPELALQPFPDVRVDALRPRIAAGADPAQLLSNIEAHLPPVAAETISPAGLDLKPLPLPFRAPEEAQQLEAEVGTTTSPVSSGDGSRAQAGEADSKLPQAATEGQSDSASDTTSVTSAGHSAAVPAGAPQAFGELLLHGFPVAEPPRQHADDSGRDAVSAEKPSPATEAESAPAEDTPAPSVPLGTAPPNDNLQPVPYDTAQTQTGATTETETTDAGPPSATAEGEAAGKPTPGGAAPLPVIALENVIGTSHFSFGQHEGGLEVAADLCLEGQVAPGRVLSLFGEQVQLEADGRFTLRLSLDNRPALAALLFSLRRRTERD